MAATALSYFKKLILLHIMKLHGNGSGFQKKIYFSHGTANARVVALLMPKKYNFEMKEI